MYNYRAKVIRVYDGDTITLELDLGFHIKITENCRLYGIDAPEVRGPTRKEGLASRDFLRKLILSKQVLVTTFKDKQGKYGRYIVKLFLEEYSEEYLNYVSLKCLSINDILVKAGHAIYKEY